MSRIHWWLRERSGARLRIDPGGVLIGRSPDCDLVLRDPKASRSQALVYLEGSAPRLVVLGKGRSLHNGARVEREVRLEAGDQIAFPGAQLELGARDVSEEVQGGWVLERPGGGFFGVSSSPFVIGGAATDDLQLDGWPEHALVLHLTQRRMHLTAQAALEVDSVALVEEALVPLTAGSRISYAGQTLRVVTGGEFSHASTVASEGGHDVHGVAERVRLEFLPRGGRLRLRIGGGERVVYLPGQRSELMALLLRPPAPYELGQPLEDDFLNERLWPKQGRSRLDLNTLVYRLRKDLVGAGIDATALVHRSPGGGGTQLGLSPAAIIELA